MKFTVTMKCPDALENAIKAAVEREVPQLANTETDEWITLSERQEEDRLTLTEDALQVCRRWFRYGEYLAVEIDTWEGTIRVLTSREQ